MLEYIMKTSRIGLRELTKDDVGEKYCNWLNDPDINAYMQSRYTIWNFDKMQKYIENISESEYIFAICLVENNEHIGNIKLGPVDWVNRKAEISILVGEKQYWGNGYGAEAVKLVSNYALNTLSLNKVFAGCYFNNKGSESVFLKNGFFKEGILKSEFAYKGGYTDILRFGKLKNND